MEEGAAARPRAAQPKPLRPLVATGGELWGVTGKQGGTAGDSPDVFLTKALEKQLPPPPAAPLPPPFAIRRPAEGGSGRL